MMNALKESSVVYKTTSLFKLSNKKVKIDFSFSPKVNTKDFLNISKHLLEQRKKERYIQMYTHLFIVKILYKEWNEKKYIVNFLEKLSQDYLDDILVRLAHHSAEIDRNIIYRLVTCYYFDYLKWHLSDEFKGICSWVLWDWKPQTSLWTYDQTLSKRGLTFHWNYNRYSCGFN